MTQAARTPFFACAALLAIATASAALAADRTDDGQIPPGGRFHECHGALVHLSAENIRVHCLDGVPKDLSFISYPKYASWTDGRTTQSKLLKPGTRVRVVFTQALGIRQAYKIFVVDPSGEDTTAIRS